MFYFYVTIRPLAYKVCEFIFCIWQMSLSKARVLKAPLPPNKSSS